MKFRRKGFAKKDNVRTSESTAAATWNPFTLPFEIVLQVRPEAHANISSMSHMLKWQGDMTASLGPSQH